MKPEEAFSVTIPPEWRSVPFWSLFRRRKQTGFVDEELLSVYRDHGIIPKSSRDDNHNKPSEDLSNYQLVTEGALVTNKMKAWQGSIGISRYRGIVSPAYYVYEPLSRENDQYLHYLLRSHPYISLYGRISKGIRVNQWDLEHEALRNIPIILPDIQEQQAIADFLDRETVRIDQLIEKKQRLVELIENKCKATIKRLVFAQEDAGRAVIPNDIVWMPCLPEDWKIQRAARIFSNQDFKRIPLNSEERADLNKVYPYYGASGIIDYVDQYIFDEELILVGEDGANLVMQSTPIAFIATGKYWVNNHAHILKPRYGSIKFWVAALNQVPYEIYVTGSAQPKLTAEALGNLRLPCPSEGEQFQIARKIETAVGGLEKLMAPLAKSIFRLREYRSALITAAVTGQIDVNEWSRRGHADAKLDAIAKEMEA